MLSYLPYQSIYLKVRKKIKGKLAIYTFIIDYQINKRRKTKKMKVLRVRAALAQTFAIQNVSN